MKNLAITLSLFLLVLCSCKKESARQSTDTESREKLYGVWESIAIRSREEQPPAKVIIVFNYIKNTPYTILEMKLIGENKKIIQRKTNVSITTRQIRPYRPDGDEITRRDQSVTLDNGKTVSQLIWDYELIGSKLTISSGLNKIILKKSLKSVQDFYRNDSKQKELFKPKL